VEILSIRYLGIGQNMACKQTCVVEHTWWSLLKWYLCLSSRKWCWEYPSTWTFERSFHYNMEDHIIERAKEKTHK